MKTILRNLKNSLFLLFLAYSSFAEINTSNNNEINNDVKKMASDFIDLKPMRGFKYQNILMFQALRVMTPFAVPKSSWSAGRSANSPLHTTPVISLMRRSVSIG